MENKTMESKALYTMNELALDVVWWFEQDNQQSARQAWNRLVGAARMYEIAFENDQNPTNSYVIESLRHACKIWDHEMRDVLKFLTK